MTNTTERINLAQFAREATNYKHYRLTGDFTDAVLPVFVFSLFFDELIILNYRSVCLSNPYMVARLSMIETATIIKEPDLGGVKYTLWCDDFLGSGNSGEPCKREFQISCTN